MPLEWRPHPGKQELFHRSGAYEAFYGGQAGGGKSESLLVEAARYVEVPGYAAILFRRTFPELSGAGGLIPRSFELFSAQARWSGHNHTWTWPSGATISFGHMQHEKDRFKYQGHQYAYIGFDEVTHFTQLQYLYLLSRARTMAGVPARLRAAGNPGNIGHEWVKARFITAFKGSRPGQIKWFALIDGADTEVGPGYPDALSRAFIPASVYDNPTLLRRNPHYVAMLKALPFVERKRLLDGDWDIQAAGNVFDPQWFKIVEKPPDGLDWVRYWDLAVSTRTTADFTASAAVALDADGRLFIRDMVRGRWPWHQAKRMLKSTIKSDLEWLLPQKEAIGRANASRARQNKRRARTGVPPLEMLRIPSIRFGIERDMAGTILFQELLEDSELAAVAIEPVGIDKDKLTRALPWSSRAEWGFENKWTGPGVYFVDGPWVPAFLNECREFSGDGTTHDDQVDTVSGGVGMLAAPAEASSVESPFYG